MINNDKTNIKSVNKLNNNNKNRLKFLDNAKKDIEKVIIDLINKLVEMDNKDEKVKNALLLKDMINNLIDQNNKNIKENNDKFTVEINQLKESNDKLTDEIDKLTDEINQLKELTKQLKENYYKLNTKIEDLEDDNKEIKGILGTIQIRDLSKNFLRAFNRYLKEDDFNKIEKDYFKKGEIIANRIREKFSANIKSKKMSTIIIHLVLTAFQSLNEGNNFAHSIIFENFEIEIENFKKNYKIKIINYTELVIFLFSIGINEGSDFENSLAFLKKSLIMDCI